MAFSTDNKDDFQSLVASLNPENSSLDEEYLLNRNVCKLPWVEIAEEKENPVSVYLGMVISTFFWIALLFDTFLAGIILAHEDLRKQVNLKTQEFPLCNSDPSFWTIRKSLDNAIRSESFRALKSAD